MIIVHGIIPLRADTRDQALAMARRMAEATQAEPGCIAYDFYVGLGDPNRLLLFQEWESMEALMAHFETPHMDEFMRELPHVVAGEIQTRRFAVQTVDEERETSAVAPPRVIH